jgi:hypothetical protein
MSLMKIIERMEMLYNQSQCKKTPYGIRLTPNERPMAEAADIEHEALRREFAAIEQRLIARLAEKQDRTARHSE